MLEKITSLEGFLTKYEDEPALNLAIEKYEAPTPENFWKWRELYRIFKEERKKPRFTLNEEIDELHNVHTNDDDPKLLSFYENEDKAARDVVTVIKFGKYLRKFYEDHYDNEQIKTHVSDHLYEVSPAELCLVEDGDVDMAATIYEDGPNSCMSKERNYIRTEGHPCSVYASPDVSLAYIKKGDRITARCVVNRNDKEYVRIYGDSGMMQPLLKDAGYRANSAALADCRILRIPAPDCGANSILMPYLDGNYTRVKHDDDEPETYMRITSGSTDSWGAQETCGHIQVRPPNSVACPDCGEYVNRDTTTVTVEHGTAGVCEECITEHYEPAIGPQAGETVFAFLSNTVHAGGQVYMNGAIAQNHGFTETEAGIWMHNDRTVQSHRDRDIDQRTATRIYFANDTHSLQLAVDANEAIYASLNDMMHDAYYSATVVDPSKSQAEGRYVVKSQLNGRVSWEDVPMVKAVGQIIPHLNLTADSDSHEIATELTRVFGNTWNVDNDPIITLIGLYFDRMGAPQTESTIDFNDPAFDLFTLAA